MPVTERLTIETVNLDDENEMDEFDNQMIDAGVKKIRAESAELIRRGLMDEQGHMLTSELPLRSC
jgi:hypothetical protein